MKQAILHVGFHKTASTSIQETLSQNRRVLRNAGWSYAKFTRFGRDASNHSVPLITLFDENSGKLGINLSAGDALEAEYRRYSAELDQNLRSDLPLILSGEGASTLNKKGLYRLRQRFADRGWQLRVIAFIRAPTPLLHSTAAQIVKGGSAGVLQKAPLANRLSRRIDAVRAVFPDAEFYPFEGTKGHEHGPVGFFLELIDPALPRHVRIRRENERISENAVALLRHLNTAIPFHIHTPKRRVNPLRMLNDSLPLHGLSGRRFYLSSADLETVSEEIAEQNAWLAENLGPQFCDTETTVLDGPVQWTDAHAAELRACLRWMPAHLRTAVASYFDDRPDLPDALKGFGARYGIGHHRLMRFLREAPGIGRLETIYRTLRRQW
ncbi:MAG: hypothetical protein QNJ44_21415 [Rhodobacter sp.]|nr:hypothetical protein [Rhodobacter sp.]